MKTFGKIIKSILLVIWVLAIAAYVLNMFVPTVTEYVDPYKTYVLGGIVILTGILVAILFVAGYRHEVNKAVDEEAFVETPKIEKAKRDKKPEVTSNDIYNGLEKIEFARHESSIIVDPKKEEADKKALEAKKKEEAAKKAEAAKKKAAEAKKAEAAKKAAEEKKKAAEAKKAAEEKKKAEEAKKAAEEKKKAAEAKKAAEEKKKAEEAKKAAEEKKKAEATKKAAEEKKKTEVKKAPAKKAEPVKKPAEVKKAPAKKAEPAKKPAEAKKAPVKKAEPVKKPAEAKKAPAKKAEPVKKPVEAKKAPAKKAEPAKKPTEVKKTESPAKKLIGLKNVKKVPYKLWDGNTVTVTEGWAEYLAKEETKAYYPKMINFVKDEYNSGDKCYPAKKNIYKCFEYTDVENVRVVIIGKIPFYRKDQADGLAYSTSADQKANQTTTVIINEAIKDLGIKPADDGSLANWAKNGVLLLNSVMTAPADKPASHTDCGWLTFTESIIKMLAKDNKPMVFVLWGEHAQSYKDIVSKNANHMVIEAPNPSPLSAANGFYGSKPFSKINAFLEEKGYAPINWELKK